MGKENASKQNANVSDVTSEKVSMYDTANSITDASKKKTLFEKLGLVESIEEDEGTAAKANLNANEKTNASNVISISEKNLFNPEEKRIEKLSIDEIYTIYSLLPRTSTNSVYLIDNFLKALPSNLPIEIKRESLNSLLEASHINLIDLVNDGKERVETLNQYLENFTLDLNEIINDNEREIAALKEKIAHHTSIIEERSRTLEEQKAIVKFEVQKISSIIDFVRSKDI